MTLLNYVLYGFILQNAKIEVESEYSILGLFSALDFTVLEGCSVGNMVDNKVLYPTLIRASYKQSRSVNLLLQFCTKFNWTNIVVINSNDSVHAILAASYAPQSDAMRRLNGQNGNLDITVTAGKEFEYFYTNESYGQQKLEDLVVQARTKSRGKI